MFIISLGLFVAMLTFEIYAIEYFQAPFGKLFYTRPLEIVLSLSKSLAYKAGIPPSYSFGVTLFLLVMIPLFVAIKMTLALKRKIKR